MKRCRNASILTTTFLAQISSVDYWYLSWERQWGTRRKIAGSKKKVFTWISYFQNQFLWGEKEHWCKKKKNPLSTRIWHASRGSPSIIPREHRVPTTLVSFHDTRSPYLLIPRAGHLFLFPSFHATRQRHGWDQPLLSSISFQSSTSNQRNRRIRCACTRVLLFDSGLFAREGVVFFFFFEVRRSDGWSWNGKGRARRRRWLEWKRDATKTKRRTFNERAHDGVADRPRLNRADSEHVGLEWAWLSDGDGRSGSERDGQCSAGGWSGLAEWG